MDFKKMVMNELVAFLFGEDHKNTIEYYDDLILYANALAAHMKVKSCDYTAETKRAIEELIIRFDPLYEEDTPRLRGQ